MPVAPGWTSRCHYHAEVPAIRARVVSENGKPPQPDVDGAPLLRVSGLSKTYRAGDALIEAVAGVSLELGRGEVLGLVGESGSGKTSLARCIAGLVEPSAGSLELEGRETPWSLRERPREVRRMVQMVFQNPDGALNRSDCGGLAWQITCATSLPSFVSRRPTSIFTLVPSPAA